MTIKCLMTCLFSALSISANADMTIIPVNGVDDLIAKLGEYNGMLDTYTILSGLTEEDYIAFPDLELCKEGVPTTRSEVSSGEAGVTP